MLVCQETWESDVSAKKFSAAQSVGFEPTLPEGI